MAGTSDNIGKFYNVFKQINGGDGMGDEDSFRSLVSNADKAQRDSLYNTFASAYQGYDGSEGRARFDSLMGWKPLEEKQEEAMPKVEAPKMEPQKADTAEVPTMRSWKDDLHEQYAQQAEQMTPYEAAARLENMEQPVTLWDRVKNRAQGPGIVDRIAQKIGLQKEWSAEDLPEVDRSENTRRRIEAEELRKVANPLLRDEYDESAAALREKVQAADAIVSPRAKYNADGTTSAETLMDPAYQAEVLYGDAAKIYEAPLKGEGGFLGRFGRGAGDRVTDNGFWSLEQKIGSNVKLRDILLKADAGTPLTDDEAMMLDAYQEKITAQMSRAENTAILYQGGQGAVDSAKFMAEMFLTSGVLKGISGKVAGRIAEKMGIDLAEKMAGKGITAIAKRYGAQMVGDLAGVSVNMMLHPTTYEGISDELVGFDDDGNLNSVGRAVTRGLYNAFKEEFSESFGERMEILGDIALQGNVGKLFSAMRDSGVHRALSAAGIQSNAGEILEEVYGSGMDAAVGWMTGNKVGDKDAMKEFVEADNMLTMLSSFAPMFAFGGTVNMANIISAKRDINASMRGLNTIRERYGLQEGDIAAMKDALNSGDITGARAEAVSLMREARGKGLNVDDAKQFYNDIVNAMTAGGRLAMDNEKMNDAMQIYDMAQLFNVYTQYSNMPFATGQAQGLTSDANDWYEDERKKAEDAGIGADILDMDAMEIADYSNEKYGDESNAESDALSRYARAKMAKQAVDDAWAEETDAMRDDAEILVDRMTNWKTGNVITTGADMRLFVTDTDAVVDPTTHRLQGPMGGKSVFTVYDAENDEYRTMTADEIGDVLVYSNKAAKMTRDAAIDAEQKAAYDAERQMRSRYKENLAAQDIAPLVGKEVMLASGVKAKLVNLQNGVAVWETGGQRFTTTPTGFRDGLMLDADGSYVLAEAENAPAAEPAKPAPAESSEDIPEPEVVPEPEAAQPETQPAAEPETAPAPAAQPSKVTRNEDLTKASDLTYVIEGQRRPVKVLADDGSQVIIESEKGRTQIPRRTFINGAMHGMPSAPAARTEAEPQTQTPAQAQPEENYGGQQEAPAPADNDMTGEGQAPAEAPTQAPAQQAPAAAPAEGELDLRTPVDFNTAGAEEIADFVEAEDQNLELAIADVEQQVKEYEKEMEKQRKVAEAPVSLTDTKKRAARANAAQELAKTTAQRDKFLEVQKILNDRKRQQVRDEQMQPVDNGGQPLAADAKTRFEGAQRVKGFSASVTTADGSRIRGHYELVPASALTPSHNPLDGYNGTPGFPTGFQGENANSRDYRNSRNLQDQVEERSRHFDGRALTELPVISPEGVVYSGNGRVMSAQLATARGSRKAYDEALADNAQQYGFTAEQVAAMPDGVAVFVTDELYPYNQSFFHKFNQRTSNSESAAATAKRQSLSLSEEAKTALAGVIDEYDTLEAFFRSIPGTRDMWNLMLRHGIVTEADRGAYIPDETQLFSSAGREFVSAVILGSMFDKATLENLENLPGLRNTLLRCSAAILANGRLGGLSLQDSIQRAVRMVIDAQTHDMNVAQVLRQGNVMEGFGAENYNDIETMLAAAFETGVDGFRKLIVKYNDLAAEAATGQMSMFGDVTVESVSEMLINEYGKEYKQYFDIAEDVRRRASGSEGTSARAGVEGDSAASGGSAESAESTESRQSVNRERRRNARFNERVGGANVRAAQELASRLGVKVNVINDAAQLPEGDEARSAIEGGQRVEGWYDVKTGEVCIYAPEYARMTRRRAESVIIHEVLAHKGLRGIFGNEKRFNAFCDSVWGMMSDSDRRDSLDYTRTAAYSRIEAKMKAGQELSTTEQALYDRWRRAAADEYVAEMAQADYEKDTAKVPLWRRICEEVRRILRSMGIRTAFTDDSIRVALIRSRRVLEASAKGESFSDAQLRREAKRIAGVSNEYGTEADDTVPENRFSIMGTAGAYNLDEAEGTTYRIDNLYLAANLEKEGYSKELIRRATGWERGTEGKWRYEELGRLVSDEDLDAMIEAVATDDDMLEKETGMYYLGTLDMAMIPELMEAYPSFKDIKLFADPTMSDDLNGSFNGLRIRINADLLKDAYKEKTEKGYLNRYVKEYGEENLRKIKEWRESENLFYDHMKESIQSVLVHEVQHAIQDYEGFARGGSSKKSDGTENEEYNRLAGEVEARNAEFRMDYTAEERKENTLEDDENIDVPRDKQIVRFSKNDPLSQNARSGLVYNEATEGVSAGARFSLRYAPQGTEEIDKAVDDIVKATGRSRADVQRWIKSEMSLAAIFGSEKYREVLDYAVDGSRSFLMTNLDYPQGTVDFNNICRKRIPATYIWQQVQHRSPNRILTAENLVTLVDILREKGIEVPCAPCFVEDRRQKLGEIAQEFLDSVKDGFKEYSSRSANKAKVADKIRKKLEGYSAEEIGGILTIDNLVTLESSNRLREEHPALYDAFVIFNNARGQQAARLFVNYAEYKREIRGWNKRAVKAKNDAGGLRIFSYSDFEVPHLLDVVQIIIDAASVGLKIQGYTKVPEFAIAVSKTGMKLNMSLIPAGSGLDASGKLIFDNVEGINTTSKFYKSISRDNPDVGNTIIGINDAHIRACMKDDRISQIIPFHTSLAKDILDKKKIGHWNNYKNFQTDKNISTGTAADKGVNIYTDVIDDARAKGEPMENRRDFVNKFLDVCRQRSLIPRFSQFLDVDASGNFVYTEGYEKFLVDFKLFDRNGDILPFNPVVAQFDDQVNREIVDRYAKGENKPNIPDGLVEEVEGRLGINGNDGEPRGGRRYSMAELAQLDRDTKAQREAEAQALSETAEGNSRFSIVPEGALKEKIMRELDGVEGVDWVWAYRAARKIDGKYYSPKMTKLGGKMNEIQMGALEQSDERPDLAYEVNGKWKVDLDGDGLNDISGVDYNPYIHTSTSVLNDQFKGAYKDPSLVVIRTKVPRSGWEAEKAEKANLAPGRQPWPGGVIDRRLGAEDKREVMLTKYDMPVGEVPVSEVADKIADMLKRNNLDAPFNVFTPQLQDALAERGVTLYRPTRGGKEVKSYDKPWAEYQKRNGMDKGKTRLSVAPESAFMDKVEQWAKDSAIRDAEGKLLPMYHGVIAGSEFTVFDKEKIGSSGAGRYEGLGFNFTPDIDRARGYGNGNAPMEVYLNIKNPASDLGKKMGFSKFLGIFMDVERQGGYDISGEYGNTLDERGAMKTARMIYDYAENNADLNAQMAVPYTGDADIMHKAWEKAGYDGVVWHDKYSGRITTAVAFERNQIKSTSGETLDDNGNVIPLSERFNDKSDDTRFSVANNNQRIFISNAEQAVEGLNMGKASPEQWLKAIQGRGGLKAGEDKWLGLSDWLRASDKKTITKQEVLDFINENAVQIEEVDYTEAVNPMWLQELKYEYRDFLDEANANGEEDVVSYAMERMKDEHGGYDFEMGFWGDERDLYADEDSDFFKYFAEQYGGRPISSVRLDYSSAGLDNKREIALTVPTIEPWNEGDVVHFGDADGGRAIAWARFGETEDKRSLTEDERRAIVDKIGDVESWTKLDGSNFVAKRDLYIPNDVGYRSTYIADCADVEKGIKGYLLVIRDKRINMYPTKQEAHDAYVQKRLEEEESRGRKTRILFIDEIQSKRHQEGREKGYKDMDAHIRALDAFQSFNREMHEKYGYNTIPADWSEADRNRFNELRDAEDVTAENISKGIPPAPFEKNWHELTFKRMLRLAAEEGYDKVAWTTGETQAERYDLSKQVPRLVVNKNEDGSYVLYAQQKDGTDISTFNAADDKELSSIVGKELSLRIINGENIVEKNGKTAQVFLEDDLRIGGEGMKGFYDDILPRFVDKYGKKWGVKVYDQELHAIEQTAHMIDVTPEMRESVMRGQVMFSVNVPTNAKTAQEAYEQAVLDRWNRTQYEFQDRQQYVRAAMEAIMQQTGNRDIADNENYLAVENHMSSIADAEKEIFVRDYYQPLVKEVNAMIDRLLKARRMPNTNKNRVELYNEVCDYMMAKHGLERNEYYNAKAEAEQRHKDILELEKAIRQRMAEHAKDMNDKRILDAVDRSKLTVDDKKRLAALKSNITLYNTIYGWDADVLNIINTNWGDDALIEAQVRQRLATEKNVKIDSIFTQYEDRDWSGLTGLYGFSTAERRADAKARYARGEMKEEDLAKELADLHREDVQNLADATYLAETNVADFENEVETDELWRLTNKATRKTLDHRYKTGQLSEAMRDDIANMFDYYVPLRGFDTDTAEDVYDYDGPNSNNYIKQDAKVQGRTSRARGPIAMIMSMADSEISSGNRNLAKQALFNFVGNRPDNDLMQIREVWYEKVKDDPNNPASDWHYEARIPALTANMNAEQINRAWEMHEEQMRQLEKQGLATKLKKGVDLPYRIANTRMESEHCITLKVGGETKCIVVLGDNKAAKAVNGDFGEKGDAGAVRAVNRFISSMVTNYSLYFTVRNFFRDQIYADTTILNKEGARYGLDFKKHVMRNFAVMMPLYTAYTSGKLKGGNLTKNQRDFVEFMEGGGKTGYTIINNIKKHEDDLTKLLKGRSRGGVVWHSAKEVATAVPKFINLLNESAELLTRFSAFQASKDAGRSKLRCISDAKNISVNFNTRGAQSGEGLAGSVARYLGMTKFFFNAGVQGLQNFSSNFKAKPGRMTGIALTYAAAGALMAFANRWIAEMFGGDPDEYYEIPEFIRRNNIVMGFKGHYMVIPLPIELRSLYGTGGIIADAIQNETIRRNPGLVALDVLSQSADLLPVNPLEGTKAGKDFKYAALDIVTPDALSPLLQHVENRDFTGAPLYKDYPYNSNAPLYTKAYSGAPRFLVAASRKMYEAGLNADKSPVSSLDWLNPEVADNYLSGIFGGQYKLVKDIAKTVDEMENGGSLRVDKAPAIGVLTRRLEDDQLYRHARSLYYDYGDVYEKWTQSARTVYGLTPEQAYGDKFGKMTQEQIAQRKRFEGTEEYDALKAYHTAKKNIDKMKKALKDMDKDSTEYLDAELEMLKAMETTMDNIMELR